MKKDCQEVQSRVRHKQEVGRNQVTVSQDRRRRSYTPGGKEVAGRRWWECSAIILVIFTHAKLPSAKNLDPSNCVLPAEISESRGKTGSGRTTRLAPNNIVEGTRWMLLRAVAN